MRSGFARMVQNLASGFGFDIEGMKAGFEFVGLKKNGRMMV